MKVKSLFLLLGLISVSGCTYRLGDFSVISSRNVDFTDDYVLVQTDVEAADVVHIIICFPTGIPNIEEAVDRALRSERGDFMTNASLYQTEWYVPLIYGQMRYSVRGDVWRRSSPHH